MNRFYQGDWIDSMASRFIEELPEKFLEKNIFNGQKVIIKMKILNLIKILKQRKKQEVLAGLGIRKELNEKGVLYNLSNLISNYKLDGYIIPKNDSFFTEQLKHDRPKLISNFSGSAGMAVVLKKLSFRG